MYSILHIDSSIRKRINDNPSHDSISKRLAHSFIENLKESSSIKAYQYRDVGMNPPPFTDQDWLGAVFTPQQSRSEQQRQKLAISDQLIQEVKVADIIVISTPMYNYGMPAQLKAWFDQIVRIHETFSFDLQRGDFPLEPILSGKTLVLITSSGEFGFEKGGVRETMNHLAPHIKTLSKYLGCEQVFEIASEYQEFADLRHQTSLETALVETRTLARKLA
ncbi:FMN-dependent NADH-azoreductase [Pseudoalteromonas luteoviolacea]|uniref:FMN dependent NADH:quinone oxidoreductase n=1 Tax=Pseudoalteromonas luteoviolacea TaxID=43657 RepID=A0A0C1QB78_9GAMM|nr:NAD(P)H-dependent oxidoreductase [Pseudoalteromonas luteoviolacea]KID56655.1 FMN-dependent NADH-azoreductase [Pseudoalteromonas luteoviolacea]